MSKRLNCVFAALLGLAFLTVATGTAFAEKRVALVIGQSAYENAPRLPNPANDANAMAGLFKKAGFTVLSANNVGLIEFLRELKKFTREARNADFAAIYYAGHGIEIDGTNYLIPTNARLRSDMDTDEAISLDRVMNSFVNVKGLRLIILDACRDNPFLKKMERIVASRAISSGLGEIKTVPTGDILVAYAAAAGSTAADGARSHSPFTEALLKYLSTPGIEIQYAFRKVRDAVLEETGTQRPYVYASLGGRKFSVIPGTVEKVIPKPRGLSASEIRARYEAAASINTIEAMDAFLSLNTKDFYAQIAKAQREKLLRAREQASLTPIAPRKAPPSLSASALAWEKLRDSNDRAALRRFLKRFGDAVEAPLAQHRLDLLDRLAHEREELERAKAAAAKAAAEKAAAETAAAEKAAAEERERKARAAAEEEQRRAKAAAEEEERKAKAAATERERRKAKAAAEEERRKAKAAAEQEERRRAKAAAEEKQRKEKAAAAAEERRKEKAAAAAEERRKQRANERAAQRRRHNQHRASRPQPQPRARQTARPSIGVLHGL